LLTETELREDLSVPAGTRFYTYVLRCGARSVEVSTASLPGRPAPDYQANKAVVDRAVATVECL